jgi:hypothetical protein
MVAAPAEDTPRLRLHGSWPLKVYEAPRIFDRKAENQPYIHWVKGSFGYVEESSDEEDVDDDDTDEGTDEEDDEHSDAPVEQKGEKTEADEQKGERKNEPEDESHIECLQAYFDYFDKFSNGDEKDDKPPEQIEADSGEDREIKEPSQRGGIAKVFMAGMTGDHLNLPYRDQVEVVVGFAEQETSDESQTLVALLDDMKSGGIISAKPKRYKPQGWNLNLDQLRAQLSKQVAGVSLVVLICKITRTNIPNSASKSDQAKVTLPMTLKGTIWRGGFCKSVRRPDHAPILTGTGSFQI